MQLLPTNLEEAVKKITMPWSPIELARVNDQVVRMALFEGEYHWHVHENEDELFFIYKGEITIQLKDQPDLILKAGEIGIIPKGVEHCPKSTRKSYVLMFEPNALKSTGSQS